MTPTSSPEKSLAHVMFGGDVMLGRIVKDVILRLGPDYPLQPVAHLMRQADLTVVNLECAMTASRARWRGAPKAFYFGAPPEAAGSLTGAGVGLVSLANNHVLDFDIAGLRETLALLSNHGIAFTGAGEDLAAALSPAWVDCRGMRIGMAAFCDHQADFAAGEGRPGIAFLALDSAQASLSLIDGALQRLKAADVDWPILSLHWGPNMVRQPSAAFRDFAHAAIDMGWRILFGHSAHVFQGIEIYRGCPILYAAGDLVDDYHVDPDFRNDHQLLFEIELARSGVRQIVLHPVFIDDCQARLASPEQAAWIFDKMSSLSGELGTTVQRSENCAWIDIDRL